MFHVTVLFLNGGCASTAILPTEIFRFAGVFWNLLRETRVEPAFRVTTASADGRAAVMDRLVSISPACAVADVERPDLVFVPAGGLPVEDLVETGYLIDEVIARNAAIVPWLRRWADDGARIAGVCSGVALIAQAGLLDGKQATTHWALDAVYRDRFPNVDWQTDRLITDAGDVYCGGGINAAADLALYLVEKFGSRAIALECAKSLLIEMPRALQLTFAQGGLRRPHGDAAIASAEDWLHANFTQPVNLEALAAQLAMSPRNFVRRFKTATGHTPREYLQGLRVAAAKHHLETGRRTVQQVCDAVGYRDPIFFRNLFRRYTGLCPARYRERFGAWAPIAPAAGRAKAQRERASSRSML
ncbi:transcriptional regulator GlxA family with amidase domain [Constrictibacter sp. MBR-5]|jgi:transcriptional regulator GlxA family with amidase domain|uniref:GlxA family transcriptional regulator n=1 Tax=Constrictibacter sp. MBR-5 TaxID=3156467 RepID=UPI00339B5E9E